MATNLSEVNASTVGNNATEAHVRMMPQINITGPISNFKDSRNKLTRKAIHSAFKNVIFPILCDMNSNKKQLHASVPLAQEFNDLKAAAETFIEIKNDVFNILTYAISKLVKSNATDPEAETNATDPEAQTQTELSYCELLQDEEELNRIMSGIYLMFENTGESPAFNAIKTALNALDVRVAGIFGNLTETMENSPFKTVLVLGAAGQLQTQNSTTLSFLNDDFKALINKFDDFLSKNSNVINGVMDMTAPMSPLDNFIKQCHPTLRPTLEINKGVIREIGENYKKTLHFLCKASNPIMVINSVNFGVSSSVHKISTFMQNLVSMTSFVHAILEEGAVETRLCGSLHGYIGSELIIEGMNSTIELVEKGENVSMEDIQAQFQSALGTVLESPALYCFLVERPWLIPGYQKVYSNAPTADELLSKAGGFMAIRQAKGLLYGQAAIAISMAVDSVLNLEPIKPLVQRLTNNANVPGKVKTTIISAGKVKGAGFIGSMVYTLDILAAKLIFPSGLGSVGREVMKFLNPDESAALLAMSRTTKGADLYPECFIERRLERKLLFAQDAQVSDKNGLSINFALWMEYEDDLSPETLKSSLLEFIRSNSTIKEATNPSAKLDAIQNGWEYSDNVTLALVEPEDVDDQATISMIKEQCKKPPIFGGMDVNGDKAEFIANAAHANILWPNVFYKIVCSFAGLVTPYFGARVRSETFPNKKRMPLKNFFELHHLEDAEVKDVDNFFRSRMNELAFTLAADDGTLSGDDLTELNKIYSEDSDFDYDPDDNQTNTWIENELNNVPDSEDEFNSVSESKKDNAPAKDDNYYEYDYSTSDDDDEPLKQMHIQPTDKATIQFAQGWQIFLEGNWFPITNIIVHKRINAEQGNGDANQTEQRRGSTAQSGAITPSAPLFNDEGDGFYSFNGGGNFFVSYADIPQMVRNMMKRNRISEAQVPLRTHLARKDALKYGINCARSSRIFLYFLKCLYPHHELTPGYVRDMAINSRSSETLRLGTTDHNNATLLNVISEAFDEYNTISRGFAVMLEAKSLKDEFKKLNLYTHTFDESEPWNPKAREVGPKGVLGAGVGESLKKADPNGTITDLETITEDRTANDDTLSLVNYAVLTTKLDDLLKTEGIKALGVEHGGDAQAIISAYEHKTSDFKELTAAQLDALKQIAALYQQLKTPEATTALRGLSEAISVNVERAKEYLSGLWPISKQKRLAADTTLNL